jgi:hypothetical protein
MSDGGRGRASLEVKLWKSFRKWSRTAVRGSLDRSVRHSWASWCYVGTVLRSAPTKEKAIIHFWPERLCQA